MDWMKEFLEDIGVENVEEALETFKQDVFPQHAVTKDQYKKKTTKIEELETELNTAKEQLEKTNDQLDDLKDKAEDKEELEQQLEQINNEYEKYKEKEKQRVKEIKKKSKLTTKLANSEVHEDALDLVAGEFDLEEMELTEDGELEGFDEQYQERKEARPGLFGEKQVTGTEPTDGETSEPNGYQAQYDKALKNGNRKEAIKIKQKAYNEGIIIN